jgi:histidinol-phosphate aminotransferase
MLSARSAVQKLQQYHPPLARREGLRLDFNENTVGCSPRVLDRLRRITTDDLARYPEREPVEALVAAHLLLVPEQVLLTNGVDEAIHLLCETYFEPEDEALVVSPTFRMYEIYAAATGARVISVQCEADFRFPLARVLSRISPATRLIAIASPNNPTGSVAEREDLLQIAAAAPQAAILVDEAYFEFHGKTVIGEIGSLENLFVARTFSKAYGLAGLRVGVLAGPQRQMPMVRRVSSPYSVNAVALSVLPAALADREHIRQYVSEVICARERLAEELTVLGLHAWSSQANFLLVRIGGRHREFVQAMRSHGILVRDRHDDPGCAGCVRITAGNESQTSQLLTVLRKVVRELNMVNEVGA